MFKKAITILGLWIGSLSLATAGMWSSTTLYIGPTLSYESISSSHIGTETFVPQLSLGLRSLLNERFFLGGEIFGGYAIGQVHNLSNLGLSLKNSWVYGVSIIPGLKLDEMLLGYLRLGVIGTRFRNLGGSQWGYEGGFGLEASITDSWNIRGEFDWIGYRSIAGIKPNEQLVSIAVIYKFGCPRCLL